MLVKSMFASKSASRLVSAGLSAGLRAYSLTEGCGNQCAYGCWE